MGTETKFNCYTDTTATTDIPKLIANVGSAAANNQPNDANITTNNGVHDSVYGLTDDACVPTVPYVPIFVDENNVIDGAKEILKIIRSNWNLNAVEFKKFTDGITNKLVGCFYKGPSEAVNLPVNHDHCHNGTDTDAATNGPDPCTLGENNNCGNLSALDRNAKKCSAERAEPEANTDVVLVRVYGNNTDLLIDRKAETRNIILLQSYGFAPSLYATFKNGLVYDYVPGVTLNTKNVLRPEVWRLVACRIAEMHRDVRRADHGSGDQRPMLWTKTQKFFDLVPEKFSDCSKHKRLEKTFLPISRMRLEFAELYKQLETLNSPLVFAHNDLLLGNVVYTEGRQTVSFIDYEYADYNFQAFDIGNHFAEFAGVDEVDYKRYPTREFQLEWLRVYLTTYLRRMHITDDEVERLYVQVNQFALASHFFWAIWSLIQAEHSTLDFDYVDYAYVRYNEYLARRAQFLSLGSASGSRRS